jgi:hypothetical protein
MESEIGPDLAEFLVTTILRISWRESETNECPIVATVFYGDDGAFRFQDSVRRGGGIRMCEAKATRQGRDPGAKGLRAQGQAAADSARRRSLR